MNIFLFDFAVLVVAFFIAAYNVLRAPDDDRTENKVSRTDESVL
jgi:hypothetical protein